MELQVALIYSLFQAVPVENEITAPKTNIKLGNKNAGIAPFNTSTK